MNRRRAVHFLVNANTIVSIIVLISNLGCDAALIECTRGQTSLSILQTIDHDGLSTVEISLLADWLPALFLLLLQLTRVLGELPMLLSMGLFDSVLCRFD